MADSLPEENPIASFEELEHYPPPPRFGNMLALGRDAHGYPRFLLGPHYPLFLTALAFCAFLIGLLFYSYYARFSLFWKVLLTLSCGAFLLSYLNVGLSRPGIAHPSRLPSGGERENGRFCHFCELVRARGTEHCEECGVCIVELDHHCPWVGKCVGRDNLLSFYVFLGCTFGNMIICFIATSTAAVMARPTH